MNNQFLTYSSLLIDFMIDMVLEQSQNQFISKNKLKTDFGWCRLYFHHHLSMQKEIR